MTARTRSAGWAAVAAATAVTTAWGTAAQAETSSHQATKVPLHQSLMSNVWKGKTAGLDRSASGRTAYFVQLAGQSALDAGSIGGSKTAPSKVLAQRAVINGTADKKRDQVVTVP